MKNDSNNSKAMEDLLKRHFADFEMAPPVGLFDKIKAELPTAANENTKPIIIMWWQHAAHRRWAGVAASVALLCVAGYYYHYNILDNNMTTTQTAKLNTIEKADGYTHIHTPDVDKLAMANNQKALKNKNNVLINAKDSRLMIDKNDIITNNNTAENTIIIENNDIINNNKTMAQINKIMPDVIIDNNFFGNDATILTAAPSILQTTTNTKNNNNAQQLRNGVHIKIESMKDVATLLLKKINKNDDLQLNIAALQNDVPKSKKQNFSVNIKGYELSFASNKP